MLKNRPSSAANYEAQRQALILEPTVVGFLAALPRPVRVVAIAEDWCGDVAAARKKVSARYEQDTTRREVVMELLRLVDIALSQEP